ncbi:MAG: phage tail protein [Armatimonadota bacterium]
MAVLGSIGDIIFQTSADLIRTFGEYSDNVSSRIGAHEVGGSEPVLEFIGPGTRAVDIPVKLNAALGVDVEADIAKAQEYCRSGQLLTLIIGGKPVGGAGAQWMLETVDATRQAFDNKGSAVLADMAMALRLARTANTPTPVSSKITKQNTQRVKA